MAIMRKKKVEDDVKNKKAAPAKKEEPKKVAKKEEPKKAAPAKKAAPVEKPEPKKDCASRSCPVKKEAKKAEPKKKPAPVEEEEIIEDEELDEEGKKSVVRRYHIVQHPNGGWTVKFQGGEKNIKIFKTQKEAHDYVVQMVKNRKKAGVKASVVVHSKKGAWRKMH